MSGKPAARVGDKVAGNVIVSGSATVLIGDAGQGCADGACKASPSVGSPVNPMLGIKVLPGETDFALAAPSPFVFTRSYASDDARIGPLGQGWSIPGASLYLEVSETATVMVDPQGRRITFDALVPGESLFSPSESLWIRRGGPVPSEGAPQPKAWEGRWIGVPEAVQRDPNAIVVMAVSGNDAFVFLAGPTRWRLAQVVDRNSYATEYQWSATGDLRAICDSAGRVYALVYTAHATTQEGDNGLRLAGVVLAYDPGRDDKPRSTFDPLAKDNDWLVRYGYDAEGDLVEVLDRMGHSVRHFGYRQHIMVRHGQPNGIDVRYTYDAYSPQGKVLMQRNLEGLDYSFEYHRDRTVVTDSLGRVDTYHFAGEAGLRRLVKHVRADGSVVERKYDYAGRLIAVVDPLGRVTRFRLGSDGRELGITRPDLTTESNRYDVKTGDLIGTEDPLGRRVLIERDVCGNPVAFVGFSGATTRYIYGRADMSDRPSRIIDAKGKSKQLTWNRLGQLESFTDCSGYTTFYTYDSDGNQTSITNAAGGVTRYFYDRAGRLLGMVLPDGGEIKNVLDHLGRRSGMSDPLGKVYRFTHDRFGNVIESVDPQGHVLIFKFDLAGRLELLINENGAESRFVYDVLDRLIGEVGFDGRRRRYGYNLAGELVEREDQQGLLTSFVRDGLGRLTALHVPATDAVPAHIQSFSYDAAGQLLEAKTPEVTVNMVYDSSGYLVDETQQHVDGWCYHHSHQHDALGVRESSRYDGVPEVQWLTYGSGRLHGVRVGSFGLDFERDALYREVRRSLLCDGVHTGLESERSYDSNGRLILQRRGLLHGGGRKTDWKREYVYDLSGQLIHIADDRIGSIRYSYDMNGQLIGSDHAGVEYAYYFDPAGNRIEFDSSLKLAPGRISVMDNRIRRLNGVGYCYDASGNVVEMTYPSGDRMELAYDGQRRLVMTKIYGHGGRTESIRYGYDAFGRRTSKEVESGEEKGKKVRFGWDGDDLVATYEAGHYWLMIPDLEGAGPLMKIESIEAGSKMPGLDAELVRLGIHDDWTCAIGGERTFGYDVDHMGTPLCLFDQGGNELWQAIPSDWACMQIEGAGWEAGRYPGQTEDVETGLFYNRHRYFDPNLGRYLTQDPIGLEGGLNLYSYTRNNPVNFSDSLGLDPMVDIAMRNNIPAWAKPDSGPQKSACRWVCEKAVGKACEYVVDTAAEATSLATDGASIVVGIAANYLVCNKGVEKVCKWECDKPPRLAQPTNQYRKPGGCADPWCLLYQK